MAKRKGYAECIKEEKLIETGVQDKNKAKELLDIAEHREKFWAEAEKEYAKKYPSLFIEGHYEIIKELFTAITSLDGWNALDHECLFAYIKEEYGEELEIDIDFLLLLKDLRNDIDYRGAKIDADRWEKNKLRIRTEIKVLKEYLKKKL